MTSLDAQQSFAARVGEILQEVIKFARELSDATEADPVVGSQADDELNFNQEGGPKGPWGRSPVELAYTTAALLYAAAGQYLRSLRQLLNDDTALFGFQVITRALLEAAARSWWILDPACSVRERVERAYDEQYYSFDELRKLAAAMRGDFANQVSSDVRLRADAAELGLHERTEKNAPFARPTGVGSPRLNATQVVAALSSHVEIADGERWYRTFSGIAHSALYAQIGYWEPVRGPGVAREHLEPALPMTAIAHAAVLSIAAYLGAIERHALLYGRDWKQLQSMRQSATTRIIALHDIHVVR